MHNRMRGAKPNFRLETFAQTAVAASLVSVWIPPDWFVPFWLLFLSVFSGEFMIEQAEDVHKQDVGQVTHSPAPRLDLCLDSDPRLDFPCMCLVSYVRVCAGVFLLFCDGRPHVSPYNTSHSMRLRECLVFVSA